MIYFQICIKIDSDKPLEALGTLVSEALFGGLPFLGGADCDLDEVPALRLSAPVFGLHVTLSGMSPNYMLRGGPDPSVYEPLVAAPISQTIEASDYCAVVLSQRAGVNATAP